MNDALVDTILFFDVLRTRVEWWNILALAFCVGLWLTVGLLIGWQL